MKQIIKHIHCPVNGWDEEINEDEFEAYCENCYYEIEESEEED